ncbi:MAG: TonB-dependent receptor domain-containing protein [Leptolyngbyaceae cyanobacterium]
MNTRFIRHCIAAFGTVITLPMVRAVPGVASFFDVDRSLLAVTHQLSQAPTPATITRIEVIPTEPGLDLVIETAQGESLEGNFSTEGNQLIVDIPNAQLAAEPFTQAEPTEGIASVEASAPTDDQVQIRITGLNAAPTGQITSTQNGLTLSVTSLAAAIAAEPIRITVTAEKQPEDLQDVPISITAFTQNELEDADITSIEQVAGLTPNFTAYTADRSFLLYSVRGLSNFNFLSRDPVAFYIDDVPYDYTGFLDLDLADLERVEVLRGPQSTLYGRNAEAGVVNIVTRQPTNESEYSAVLGFGNFNNVDARVAINEPLVEDKLFLRASGSLDRRDGYLFNTVTEQGVDGTSGGRGRLRLLWTPSEDWEIDLNASLDSYRDGTLPISRPDLGQSPSETDINVDGFNDLDTNAQSLRVAYEGSEFRFTSISARRFSDQEFRNDSDGTRLDQLEQFADIDSTVLSQELRLQSVDETDPLTWLVGAYYERRDFNVGKEGFLLGADFGGPSVSVTQAEIDEDTYAAFGQVSYRPIDPLTLTAGLRYEIFNSTLVENRAESLLGVAAFADESNDGDQLLPRVAIEYQITPDVMVYGSITRGYRAQGVNFRATQPGQLFFDAETSWNYEVGLRSSWLGDRLAANLTLFHNPVEDYQVPSTDPATGLFGFVDNARVTINGIEAELRATPVDGFDLTAGFGFLDATYTDYEDPNLGDFDGNTLPYSPEYTFNVAAQYRSPNGIFGRFELLGFGTTFFNDDNSLKQEPYVLVNGRLGYEFDANQGVYLFANNIFDYRPLTTNAVFFGGTLETATYGAPATYGIQYRARF